MKKTFSTRKYRTVAEMDTALEKSDLADVFAARGVVKRPVLRKINLDLPDAVVRQIDHIAAKVGVARQPLLKLWIHERLKAEGD